MNHQEMILIEDTGEGMSITNDAENVVQEVHGEVGLSGRVLMYRDTEGRIDQLLHQDNRFTMFKLVDDENMQKILNRIYTFTRLREKCIQTFWG